MKLNKNIPTILFVLLLLASTSHAQVNRSGLKNNHSKTGKSVAVIRHGITGQVSYDIGGAIFIGAGYNASQYFGIGNRFMQQSVLYQIGIQPSKFGNDELESPFIHSVLGTFHCSYLGTTDLSPLIYGVVVQFATAKDKYVLQDVRDRHTRKGEYMSNIYLRPELGIAYPFRYSSKTKEKVPVTFSLTYGYNFNLFMRRKDDVRGKNPDDKIPWTASDHHMITLRFNFNLAHYREFQ